MILIGDVSHVTVLANSTHLAVVGNSSEEVGFVTEIGLGAVPGDHRVVFYLEEVSPGTARSTTGRTHYCIYPGVRCQMDLA